MATATHALTWAGAAQTVTVRSLPSWRFPHSSLLDDLGRVRRVKATPADAVASRAWTRWPRPRAGSYEQDGEQQGTGQPEPPGQGMITVQLACN
jgi:hypothetical protein